MSKDKAYVCDSCGAEFAKWSGKCSVCGEWNTLKEIILGSSVSSVHKAEAQQTIRLSKIKNEQNARIKSGISEFDLVMGGGIVPGSIILIGGEPGIGKSTLILQIADSIALGQTSGSVLYVSGEESFYQIKDRAERLKIKSDLELLAETEVANIIATAGKIKPALVIIDSIQSTSDARVSSSSGSISQVKACGLALQRFAKESNISVIMIGHVTKTGSVAGPKTLEHLVDTVVYLEGERFGFFRILRCSKNRFGSVNEVGIFEMTSGGLRQVKKDTTFLDLKEKDKVEGSAITAVIEGTRPFLIEIQALATKSHMGFPQRKASGFDYNRMQLLLAVLASRAGIRVFDYDIYLNVAGGFKIKDSSCDLAAACAIASAIKKRPIKKELAIIGEIGLAGDVRTVPMLSKRIGEVRSLGFKKIIVPKSLGKTLTTNDKLVKIIEISNINQAFLKIF